MLLYRNMSLPLVSVSKNTTVFHDLQPSAIAHVQHKRSGIISRISPQ